MTTEQLQALKADIAADPAFASVPHNLDGAFAIKDAYNLNAAPEYLVYRTSVTQDEVMLNGFDWTRVDNLSVGKARCWEWMFFTGSINPSKANIRAGINAVWVGTTADLNVRAAVYAHCYRPASRFEKLFATGAGTAPDANGAGPGTMAVEGPLTPYDVMDAWNS